MSENRLSRDPRGSAPGSRCRLGLLLAASLIAIVGATNACGQARRSVGFGRSLTDSPLSDLESDQAFRYGVTEIASQLAPRKAPNSSSLPKQTAAPTSATRPAGPFDMSTSRGNLAAPLPPRHGWFSHGTRNHPDRHIGRGMPLVGTSWLNRPMHSGTFAGGIYGDTVQPNLKRGEDLLGGYRLGWDFDHYWGTEVRFAFADVELQPLRSHSQDWFWDLQLAYYPWGDSRIRPFVQAGIGSSQFRFTDASGRRVDDIVLHFPVGVGVKYYWRPWLALRGELVDNISTGTSAVNTMHSLMLTAGVEIRFGGRPTRYRY